MYLSDSMYVNQKAELISSHFQYFASFHLIIWDVLVAIAR